MPGDAPGTGTSRASQRDAAGRSVVEVSIEGDVREFLTTRRAQATPEQAGFPSVGQRRVPGLRREEVALRAGLSLDRYVRLERGNLAGASEQVLDALACALLLDDADRAHLFDLAQAATVPARTSPQRASPRVRPIILRVLESLEEPSYLRNVHLDVLAANTAGFALFDGLLDRDRLPLNLARLLFLDPRARELLPEWDVVADEVVALLRGAGETDPDDRGLTDLVGELIARSEEFTSRWARHEARQRRRRARRFHHREVGDIVLTQETIEIAGDGLTLVSFTAEPDSAAGAALLELAGGSRHLPSAPGTET